MNSPAPDLDDPGAVTRLTPGGGGGPRTRWVWVSAVLAGVVIVLAAYLVLRLFGDGSGPRVTVPDFVGRSLADARVIADAVGLELIPTGEPSDRPPSTVIAQQPGPGRVVDQGSRISVTIATAADLVTVPDLRGVPEANALGLLADAGLVVGSRTEAPDPLVVSGSIIGQDPPAAAEVPRGTPVSYVVSIGPPSSPTRGPSPTPAPLATASPSTDGSLVVGDYQCLTLVEATARLERDGFSRGTVSYSIEGGPVDDTWIVQSQAPLPGARRPPGAGVSLLLASPFSTCLGE